MKTNITGLIFGVMAVLACRELSANETQKISLPVELNQMIDEALEIKRQAMRHENMRSFELIDGQEPNVGIAGKRFNGIIDRISEVRLSEDIMKSADELQYVDIRAKIIVWALDRKERKAEYDRFAKYYVNRPSHEEAEEYFSRVPLKNSSGEVAPQVDPFADASRVFVPRPGGWKPDPVDEEDKDKKFRLIMEYLFYAPPTGQRFDRDIYRPNLSDALINIGNWEKSMIVMSNDIEMALTVDISEYNAERIRSENEYGPLYFFINAPTEKSLSLLAKLWKHESIRQNTMEIFKRFWEFPFGGEYQKSKALYDAWQALARKEWQSPKEQEFAKWLRSFDPPKDPSATE